LGGGESCCFLVLIVPGSGPALLLRCHNAIWHHTSRDNPALRVDYFRREDAGSSERLVIT